MSKVNALFTKNPYASVMFAGMENLVRKGLALAGTFLLAALLLPATAFAQSETVDWANAGIPSQGSLPSGTTATGSDGTVATVTYSVQTQGGGSFAPAFAPTFVSYFNGTIGGAASPLLSGFNNAQFDPGDKITITIDLSRSVSGLQFSLGDIDQGNYTDAVEVYYDDGAGSGFVNAATNTAFWTIGSSVARTNDATVNGWRGTGGAATASTDGNVNFNFAGQSVQRVRIVYFSYTGSGDPGNQFLGISDFDYFARGADLSLTKTLVGSPPVQGGTAVWRLTATNASNSDFAADGVVVEDALPAGFNFGSSSGDGSFNSANGQWTIGTLAPGESATLTISGSITASAGTNITNTAEIIASSVADPDSTPNNGNNSEDDFASSTFTVQSGRAPGVPPVLACPVGVSVFDWDAVTSWANGSTNNTYSFGSFGDVNFSLTNDGAYVSNGIWGGDVPNLGTYFNGGLNPVEDVLQIVSDQADRSGEVVLTISLPRSFTGLQFSIFDVDFGTNQFADRLIVTGSNNGASVNPTLTNGNVNFVSGNSVIGDGAAANDQATGNVVVTFTQAVDTVVIRYGNANTAPANPGQQGIGVHDLFFCSPQVDLTVSKVSSIIADPVNGTNNPKAIPGATVEYLITVTNTGVDATFADTVSVLDTGPADARMCLISRSGGPVIFNDPGSNTGLGYSFAGLGSGADNIEFSSDNGSSFTYTPVDDGTGCDANITDFRVNPSGPMAGGSTFTLTVRYEIE
ncbi:DUF11 domain-containing protein [Erythrobacter sp. SCSIO 43205]|uniref:DUF11 domain-containing protein n=1 Tax=Erythrobacter sp. SCSIO 43205 TaxID=2779361 RepID=UPI00210411E1|nr:DUF11 domain-containing protein [Erythrobacter sp. SCSIO 43205]